MRSIFLTFGLFFTFLTADAQGSIFHVKGGATLGFQKWNNRTTEALIRYHAIFGIESYSADEPFSLFAQTGYHVRGGATRIQGGTFTDPNGGFFDFNTTSYPYEFRNISLALGAKQKFPLGGVKGYYLLGVRGEYTINTNLEMYHPDDDPFPQFSLIHPFDELTRHWQYGVIAGGGIEFMFNELIGGLLEVTINPDLSQQYFQADFLYRDPFTGNDRTLSAREIRNVTVEVTAGFRFLRIIEYVDFVF